MIPGGGSWEGWGVLSKLERPPWRFLGEVAGRVGVSRLNWRDPHGGSWGVSGRAGCLCVLCMWVGAASLLFLLGRPPPPGQRQGEGC